jgi:hypothetical protein
LLRALGSNELHLRLTRRVDIVNDHPCGIDTRDGRDPPPLKWSKAHAATQCGAVRASEPAASVERRALYATDIRKANHGALKNPLFRCVIVSSSGIFPFGPSAPLGPSCGANFQGGLIMLKMLTAAAASFAMLTAAAAADLPRRQPPPPAPAPVGKAPIGKFPVGKYPGKYPTPAPIVTKG